jgi:hypothetical protein
MASRHTMDGNAAKNNIVIASQRVGANGSRERAPDDRLRAAR